MNSVNPSHGKVSIYYELNINRAWTIGLSRDNKEAHGSDISSQEFDEGKIQEIRGVLPRPVADLGQLQTVQHSGQ